MSMDMSVFFAENVQEAEATKEVIVSNRFKDKDGNPVAFVVRAISEAENTELRKDSIKRVKDKRTVRNEVDNDAYLAKLAIACTVVPNFKDAALQKSYGVLGADNLVRKMLLAGEFMRLLEAISEINGFDEDLTEMKDEVKN